MKKIHEREYLEEMVAAPAEWSSFVELLAGRVRTDAQTGQALTPDYLVDRLKAGFDPLRWTIGYEDANLLQRLWRIGNPGLISAALPLMDLQSVTFPRKFSDAFIGAVYKDKVTNVAERLFAAGFAGHSASVLAADATPARFEAALDNLQQTGAVIGLDELLQLCLDKESARSAAFLSRNFSVEGSEPARRRMVSSVLKWHNNAELILEVFERYKLSEIVKVDRGVRSGVVVHAVAGRPDRERLLNHLLSCGADVNERDANGRTPLMNELGRRQSRAASSAAVIDWIARGADVNAFDSEGKSVLAHAVAHGKVEAIDLMYRAGLSLMARDARGIVAFRTGAGGAYCQHLLGRSIPDGNNLAMVAAAGAWPQLLREAFARGDDPAHLNDSGFNVLDVALGMTVWHLPHKQQEPEVFQILSEAGVDMNAPLSIRVDKVPLLRHPLHHLVACCEEGVAQHLPMLKAYLSAPGIDVDVLDEKGFTPLYCAVKGGEPSVVKALLDAGADTGVRCGRYTLMGQAKSDAIKALLRSAATADKVVDAVSVGLESDAPEATSRLRPTAAL